MSKESTAKKAAYYAARANQQGKRLQEINAQNASRRRSRTQLTPADAATLDKKNSSGKAKGVATSSGGGRGRKMSARSSRPNPRAEIKRS